jgi:hypothetical protein
MSGRLLLCWAWRAVTVFAAVAIAVAVLIAVTVTLTIAVTVIAIAITITTAIVAIVAIVTIVALVAVAVAIAIAFAVDIAVAITVAIMIAPLSRWPLCRHHCGPSGSCCHNCHLQLWHPPLPIAATIAHHDCAAITLSIALSPPLPIVIAQPLSKNNAVNLILRLFLYHILHTMSSWRHESTHNSTNNQQTPPPWWWSHLPLQRHGFNESTPPEGQAALRIHFLRRLLKGLVKFIKLK